MSIARNICAVMGAALSCSAASAMPADEIAKKALESTMFSTTDAQATLDLEVQKDGQSLRKRRLLAWVKRVGGASRSYVEFTAPAEVAGTKFLSLEENGETKQFIYLPAFKKVKRIVGAQKSQSFVGTDFSYADLEGRDVKLWTWKSLPDEKVQGEDCYVIEGSTVAPDTVYDRLKVWVHKEHFVPLRTELYAPGKATPDKRLTVNRLGKRDERWVTLESTMESPEKGTSTRLVVAALDTKSAIPDERFSKEALER
ncbi:MAG: outer membrane lipoprotein-sorting protein [Myxococcota bacterium]